MKKTQKNENILLRNDIDGVATLTLNRPEFNLLSIDLLMALQSQFEHIATDTSVRVVVIESQGKAFCGGHDLQEMRAYPSKKDINNLFTQCSKMMIGITKLPQPVIAKVHGSAAAAGCQLVAQCDLAVASDTAQFGTSGINIGLFCSTPMVAVTRNVSRKHAMELLLTGDLISASDAEKFGLINKVALPHELDQTVDKLATKIANKSPLAVSLGKELFYKQIEEGISEAYQHATDVITCNMMSEDATSGVDAFLSKKPLPQWKGK